MGESVISSYKPTGFRLWLDASGCGAGLQVAKPIEIPTNKRVVGIFIFQVVENQALIEDFFQGSNLVQHNPARLILAHGAAFSAWVVLKK